MEASPPADAKQIYEEAQKIIPENLALIRKDAPTYILEPAISEEDVSPVMSYLRKTEQALAKKGHKIFARPYSAKDDWMKNLTDEEGILAKMMPVFCRDAKEDPRTRFVIRLVRKEGEETGVEAIKRFISAQIIKNKFAADETSASIIIWKNIRFVEITADDIRYLNTTIDLLTDITMMECDRYGKEDQYPGKIPDSLREKFLLLLGSSISNLDDLKGLPLDEALRRIFTGFLLKVRAINWESIATWKRANDTVLQAL